MSSKKSGSEGTNHQSLTHEDILSASVRVDPDP